MEGRVGDRRQIARRDRRFAQGSGDRTPARSGCAKRLGSTPPSIRAWCARRHWPLTARCAERVRTEQGGQRQERAGRLRPSGPGPTGSLKQREILTEVLAQW